MTELLNTTQTALVDWTSKAINSGWLAPEALAQVNAVQASTPSELFSGTDRPLVVGFFGGTGVGKSSLMNRLAGDAIARASAQRPTSTDITAYVHTSVRVDRLPPQFPMDKLRTAMHHNADYASVLWLDMPDFDSVETTHRDLVEQWLPFIDVLVYVVSPERYRDDEGWRLLQQHGQRHAWLFVMNHWDRGDPVQKDDFQQLLKTAGLDNPLLFCTDCNPDKPSATDDFQQFDETIQALADQQLIDELEKHGVFQRLGEIQQTASSLKTSLGDEHLIDRWQSLWKNQWQQHRDELSQAVQWQIPNLAEHYAEANAPFWLRWMPGASSRSNSTTEPNNASTKNLAQQSVSQLLDSVALQRIDDGIAAFVHDARAEDVHTQGLHDVLSRRRNELPARLTQTANQALHASLHKPGEAWQRILHKSLGVLTTLLPLAAMGWAGYKLVNGFAQGTATGLDYLGVNFAVHTAMLVALAWAVPKVLHSKTKPSRVKAAQRGLQQGLQDALDDAEQHIAAGINQAGEVRDELVKEIQQLNEASVVEGHRPAMSQAVKRLLVN